MSSDGYFRPAEAHDARYLATRLRPGDVAELIAQSGPDCDIQGVLLSSLAMSSTCWAGCAADGEPMSLLGVSPICLLDGIGMPWMLCSTRVEQFPKAMLKEGRLKIKEIQVLYPNLINYVHAGNEPAVRWLRRLGFSIHDPEPYGVAGEMFSRFTMGEPGCT